jgi:hypothetical protein
MQIVRGSICCLFYACLARAKTWILYSYLKVKGTVSSEMDQAKSGLIRKLFSMERRGDF